MGKLDDSMNNLKNIATKCKSKNKARVLETISQLKSYLVFLNSSSISPETSARLADHFRKPLLPVYSAFPRAALRFAAALAQELYEGKILTDFTAGKHDQKLLWNSILDSLLSGVLDYHDDDASDQCKELIGAELYPTLCSIFFSVSISHMSVNLRCTGYTLLSDCAESHKANQKRLRNSSVLGGLKLGSMLWRTRDYLVLESILNLFARMIPSTKGTTAGRTERSAFVRSVFVQSTPDNVKTGEELAKMLERVPSSDWDQTASKIVDLLSASNITFPQPFSITEIAACGEKRPSDRLFVDDKGFIANVLIGEDLYESLAIAYTSIVNIKVTCRTANKDKETNLNIQVSLSSPPTIGGEVIHLGSSDGTFADPIVTFTLNRSDLPRLNEVLKNRGLSQQITTLTIVKLSLAESPANLEMDSTGVLSGNNEFQQRIENLSQLYGMNQSNDDLSAGLSLQLGSNENDDALPDANESGSPIISPKITATDSLFTSSKLLHNDLAALIPAPATLVSVTGPVDKSTGSSLVEGSTLELAPAPLTPLRRTASQLLRDAAFGNTDDELSDVEDPPAPPKRPQKKYARDLLGFKSSLVEATLDSDHNEDVPTSSPTPAPKPKLMPRAGNTSRKSIVLSDDEVEDVPPEPKNDPGDEIEDVLPASKISDSSVSRRRSVLRMSPLVRSRTHRASGRNKAVLAPKNTSKASSPLHELAVPEETDVKALSSGSDFLKDSVILKALEVDLLAPEDRTLVKTPTTCAIVARCEVIETPHKSRAQEPILRSSSPMPVAKTDRKSLKSALRKKDGGIRQPSGDGTNMRKRKRGGNEDTEAELANNFKLEPSPKRNKHKPSPVDDGIPAETTESQVLKPRNTAAVRATKHYRARKGKASSPPQIDGINYDKIPTPPSSVRNVKIEPTTHTSHPAAKEPASSVNEASGIAKRTRGATAAVNAKDAEIRTTTNVAKEPTGKVKSANAIDDEPAVYEELKAGDVEKSRNATSSKGSKQHAQSGQEPLEPAVEETENDNDIELQELRSQSQQKVSRSGKNPKPQTRRKVNKAPWNILTASAACGFHPEKTSSNVVHAPPKAVQESGVDESNKPSPERNDSPDSGTSLSPQSEKVVRISKENMTENSEQTMNAEISANLVEAMDLTMEIPPIKQERPVKRTVVFKSQTVDADATGHGRVNDPAEDQNLAESAYADWPDIRAHGRLAGPSILQQLERTDLMMSSTPSRRADTQSGKPGKLRAVKIVKGQGAEGSVKSRRNAQVPSTEDLAKVLEEIQQAILRKVNGKIEGVRHTVRVHRDRLLREAVADLSEMHMESIDHYNNLIDLEAQYAMFGRNLSHGFEDIVKANQHVRDHVRKIIETHDRCTLSKKMPMSVFAASVPASILKFKG